MGALHFGSHGEGLHVRGLWAVRYESGCGVLDQDEDFQRALTRHGRVGGSKYLRLEGAFPRVVCERWEDPCV